MPSSAAMVLVSCPTTTRSITCLSRWVSIARRAATAARSSLSSARLPAPASAPLTLSRRSLLRTGLRRKSGRPLAHGRHRHLQIGAAGDKYDRRAPLFRLEPALQVQPIHAPQRQIDDETAEAASRCVGKERLG